MRKSDPARIGSIAILRVIAATPRRLDPNQRLVSPDDSNLQQGNGPDAVLIPHIFEETEYVGP